MLETTEWLGGTTAYSAGTCWVPDNRFQRADGVTDDHAVASRYLDALVGDRAPRELREAYLARGPEMIDYFDGLGVRFWPSKQVVDYHPEIHGAGLAGGRWSRRRSTGARWARRTSAASVARCRSSPCSAAP